MTAETFQQQQRTALVLGMTGAFGRSVAAALAARGWQITALVRDNAKGNAELVRTGLHAKLVEGDARDSSVVRGAAAGASLIVHGANPARYHRWRELAIPMLGATIAAAEATGTRILFPGNLYVYSTQNGSVVDETSPQTAVCGKGLIRREMEDMLAAAATRGIASITIRAGDFFGPGAQASWFGSVVAKGGRACRRISDPCIDGAGHAWAYLPDLAEAAARIVEHTDDLSPYEVFHFGGHWTSTGGEMAEAVRRCLLPRAVPIAAFPWRLVSVGGLFVPFLRELRQVRWLWRHPLRLNNAKLERLIGPEPHTPLDQAVAASLDG